MKADLLSRGVSPCDADDGIESAMMEQDVNEHELLQRVASARASKLDDLDKGVARRRLFGYLSRRGFSSENIRKWIDTRWSAELY